METPWGISKKATLKNIIGLLNLNFNILNRLQMVLLV